MSATGSGYVLTDARIAPNEPGYLWRCDECRSLVLAEDVSDHERWHEDITPEPDSNADTLRQVAAVLDEGWPRGRVLPRMVGAEDQARVSALRTIIATRAPELAPTKDKTP